MREPIGNVDIWECNRRGEPAFHPYVTWVYIIGGLRKQDDRRKDCLVQEKLGGEYTRLQYMCQATLDEKSAKDIRIYQAQKWFLEEFASIREKARKL